MRIPLSSLVSRYYHVENQHPFHWNRAEKPLPSSEIEFLHFHNSVEIGYCESGNGLFVIGEQFESIRPGDAVFVAPGVRHYSKSLDCCMCHFIFLYPDALPDTFIRTDALNRRLCSAYSQVLRGEAARLCERTTRAFQIRAEDTKGMERATVLLCELAMMLRDASPDAAESAAWEGGVPDGIVRDPVAYDAAAYMKLHYAEPLKIHKLAEIHHLSESRFRKRFTAAYGFTPYAYLLRLRANIGAELLRRSQLTVSEVAEAVGFGCDSEFYRCFLDVYGLPPSVWRREIQGEKAE